jgi:hypothetical protein
MLETYSRTKYREGAVIPTRFWKAFVDSPPPAPQHPDWIDVDYIVPPLEEAYEEITPNSAGSHRTWKSFQHFKTSVLGDPMMYAVPSVAYYGGFASLPYEAVVRHPLYLYWENTRFGSLSMLDKNPDLALLYSKDASGSFIPLPASLESLKQQSLNVMLPLIKSNISLMNSVYELKDWPSLAQTLTKMRLFARDLWRHGKTTVRNWAGTGSDAFLQWKFNIRPVLSDITGIHASLTRLERRLNDLITRAGRVQQMHFAFNWNEYPDLVSTIASWNSTNQLTAKLAAANLVGPTSSVKYVRSATYSPSKFHAEIRYNYNYTDYQLVHAQALALLDSLGVNYNPKILWDALPWSFVIDWVVGVGRLLDQFKVRQFEPQINIHGYLWSVRRERRIIVTRQVLDSELPSRGPNPKRSVIPLPVVVSSAYRRSVGLPLSSSVTLSGLNSSEFTLGAALVVSQRRFHRHK